MTRKCLNFDLSLPNGFMQNSYSTHGSTLLYCFTLKGPWSEGACLLLVPDGIDFCYTYPRINSAYFLQDSDLRGSDNITNVLSFQSGSSAHLSLQLVEMDIGLYHTERELPVLLASDLSP